MQCRVRRFAGLRNGGPGPGEPGLVGQSLLSCRSGWDFSSGCSWEADPWQEAVAGRSHRGGGRPATGFSAAPSLLFSPSLPDPIPAPRSGSCSSRQDSCFPAPLRFPPSPFPGVGATSGLSQERSGLGEDGAGPADVPWTQGRASGAPRRGWRRNPAPSRARAAAREPIPAWSTTPALRGGAGGVLRGMVWREETRARTPLLSGPAARVGSAGSWARGARRPHAPRRAVPAGVRPRAPPSTSQRTSAAGAAAGSDAFLRSGPSNSDAQAVSALMAPLPPLGLGAEGREQF